MTHVELITEMPSLQIQMFLALETLIGNIMRKLEYAYKLKMESNFWTLMQLMLTWQILTSSGINLIVKD